jgi:hypothetical protein
MNMPNPFKYGTIVTGEDFADRKEELQLLTRELTSGQNILLYSPRRYGKTSLMTMVLEKLQKQNIITALVDLYGCLSLSDFIGKLVEKTVVPAYSKVDTMMNFLKSALSGFTPEVTVNPDGSVKLSYRKEASRIAEKDLSEVLDSSEKLAETKNARLVVVFDEFQEITNLDGARIEHLMRTVFQHHRLVTYVFMGSKRHLLEEMFNDANRPFYKFAKPFPLGKIPRKEFGDFVKVKFEKTKISIDSSIVNSVLTFTEGHPYFTQELCHEIWNLSCDKGEVEAQDIEKAKINILRMQNDLFLRMWDKMTIPQRKLVAAIGGEHEVSAIYSNSFIEKYGLVSSSSVLRSVNQLTNEGTIEKTNGKYSLPDIFFREWVLAKTTSDESRL